MRLVSSAITSRNITRPHSAWRHRRHCSSLLPQQRTQRIRLGPLVYLLPLYNPLRLIEEVCMLDQLSGGRLELGVGRGVTPYELQYYGTDPGSTRAIFNEALAVLIAGLTNRRLTFKGEHYRYSNVPMELHPYQQPYPPLWYPTHNPESVRYAARHGYNFVGLGPAAAVREHVDAYRQTWELHRLDPDRLNGHVASPKIGILRQVVVADSDEEALAAARAAHGDWYRSITKLWHDHDDHSVDGLFAWDTATQFETVIFGSPARVREQIAQVGGGEWLQLRDMCVRVGYIVPPADTALATPVCARSDARLFWKLHGGDISPNR